MNPKPGHFTLKPAHTVAAAAVATIVALGTLWSVVELFNSRGKPFAELVIAERACAQLTFTSEQRACVERWISEHMATRVAHR